MQNGVEHPVRPLHAPSGQFPNSLEDGVAVAVLFGQDRQDDRRRGSGYQVLVDLHDFTRRAALTNSNSSVHSGIIHGSARYINGWTPWGEQAIELVGYIGAPILGGLIASRRPENPYGWLWLGLGLSFALMVLAEPYAAYALVVDPGSLSAPRIVNRMLGLGWGMFITLIPFVLLLVPTGRLPSRRWKFLAWVVLAGGAAILALGLLSSESGGFGPVENPFAVGGVAGESITTIDFAAVLVIFVAVTLSALSLVVRYHRASGVEHQQLKWIALAAVCICGLIVADQLNLDLLLGDALWNLLDVATFAGLYVAVGVAILRYRLYDIDILINRTLVCGSLTALLALVYFGSVTATQAIFRTLTGQEEQPQLAVVVSTLVIAALFNPLRRRIQSFIDRRFYRSKYDARKTLEAFSSKLRDETDLEALNDDLVGVVRETMQPSNVSLWLHPETAPKGEQEV